MRNGARRQEKGTGKVSKPRAADTKHAADFLLIMLCTKLVGKETEGVFLQLDWARYFQLALRPLRPLREALIGARRIMSFRV
jgi:hypothetical protein